MAMSACRSPLVESVDSVPSTPDAAPSRVDPTADPVPPVPDAAPAPVGATVDPVPPIPDAAHAKVGAVIDAPDLESAVNATRILLEEAGIAVGDGVPEASPPPAGLTLSEAQLVRVARDARNRVTTGRTNLSELAHTLHLLGVPVSSDLPPDFALQQFLAAWVNQARANPGDPAGAPALFLAALAHRQSPSIDITKVSYDPSALRLGLLDLNLFAAGIARMASVFRGDLPVPEAEGQARSHVWQTFLDVLMPRAYAAEGPCSALKERLEKAVAFMGDAFGYGAGKATEAVLSACTAAWAEFLGAEDPGAIADGFGKVLGAVGLLMKMQAVVELYTSTTASLEVFGDNPIHQPIADQEADRFLAVKVLAGIPDDEWDAFKSEQDAELRGLEDCAKSLGIPLATDEADLAGMITKWRVRWRLFGAPIEYADATDFEFPGHQTNHLKMEGDHKGADLLSLRIRPESASNHPGDLITEPVQVVAEIATDRPPDAGTFISVVEGALAGNVVGALLGVGAGVADILIGWYQAVNTIDATAVINVTRHQFNPGLWHGTIAITESGHKSTYERREITKAESNVPGWVAESRYHTFTRRDTIAVREVQYADAGSDGNESAALIGRDRGTVEDISGNVKAQERHDVSGCWTEDTLSTRNYLLGYVNDDAEVSINIDGSRYTIEVRRPEVAAQGTTTSHSAWKMHGGCSYAGKTEDTQDSSSEISDYFDDRFGREIDPDSPNHLSGSLTLPVGSGPAPGTITFQWDLRRDPD